MPCSSRLGQGSTMFMRQANAGMSTRRASSSFKPSPAFALSLAVQNHRHQAAGNHHSCQMSCHQQRLGCLLLLPQPAVSCQAMELPLLLMHLDLLGTAGPAGWSHEPTLVQLPATLVDICTQARGILDLHRSLGFC